MGHVCEPESPGRAILMLSVVNVYLYELPPAAVTNHHTLSERHLRVLEVRSPKRVSQG